MVHRFLDVSLNEDTRQLLKGGREVHLSPKAFELLLLLMRQRERALSKSELQETLWPSTFVGETNLPTLVAEIRRCLEDSAQEPGIVRTIHRFGYRFVAEVDEERFSSKGPTATTMYLSMHDQRYPLGEGSAVIGRARDATVRIDAGGVSRHHARIVVNGGEATIEDLGSKNGTFLDGHPLTGVGVLKEGSEIRLGPVSLTFRSATPTLPTETMIDGRR